MTDRADLPARLRSIAGVMEQLQLNAARSPAETTATIREAAARIEALEVALKPFAIAADDMDDEPNERADIWERAAGLSITVGDLRRARALSQTSKPEGETR